MSEEHPEIVGGGEEELPPEPQSASADSNAGTAADHGVEAIHVPSAEDLARLEAENDAAVDRELRRMTRRGFLVAGIAAGAGYASWSWLRSRPKIDGVPWPFRRALELNESLATAYFSGARLSRTFRRDEVTQARINGGLGLSPDYDASGWTLEIEGAAAPATLTLDEIRAFPRRQVITELRCIEGWSYVVQWLGTRLSDVIARYPPPTRDGSTPDVMNHPERLVRYVSIETPGRGYYVGLDMKSALHPQTLLAYAMNDAPLTWQHGAPLRLAIPVKYGVKNIKRIGTIRYTDVKPADYWAERGYDWYAGH